MIACQILSPQLQKVILSKMRTFVAISTSTVHVFLETLILIHVIKELLSIYGTLNLTADFSNVLPVDFIQFSSSQHISGNTILILGNKRFLCPKIVYNISSFFSYHKW
jgi:hypothetical protein